MSTYTQVAQKIKRALLFTPQAVWVGVRPTPSGTSLAVRIFKPDGFDFDRCLGWTLLGRYTAAIPITWLEEDVRHVIQTGAVVDVRLTEDDD